LTIDIVDINDQDLNIIFSIFF